MLVGDNLSFHRLGDCCLVSYENLANRDALVHGPFRYLGITRDIQLINNANAALDNDFELMLAPWLHAGFVGVHMAANKFRQCCIEHFQRLPKHIQFAKIALQKRICPLDMLVHSLKLDPNRHFKLRQQFPAANPITEI